MNKRYLLQMAVWFLFGTLWILERHWIYVCFGCVGGGVLLWAHRRRQPKQKRVMIHGFFLILFYCLGAINGLRASSCTTFSNQQFLSDSNICFTGTIEKKEYKNDQWVYTLSHIQLPKETYGVSSLRGSFVVFTTEGEYPLDGTVYVSGDVRPFRRAQNDGGFDEASYYRSMMVHVLVEVHTMRVIHAPYLGIRERLFRLRERILAVYQVYLPGEESGILAAMTLGEKRALSMEAKNLFQDTGISHILAISGLHISMVGMLLFRLLRKRHAPLPSAVASSIVVVLYGLLTGSSVSTERAVGMFLVLMVANVCGSGYDMLSAVALMAMVLLWQNPYAYGQVGFVFSFGAVIGVVGVAKPLQETYERLCDFRWRTHHRMDHGKKFHKTAKEVLASNLIAGTGIQLASLPLCAYFFYGFPVYVVGVNLLVLPVLGVLIACGLLGGLLGGITGALWGLHPALSACFLPCHVILYFYEALSTWSLRLPAARLIVGRPAMWQMVLYYVILYVGVWAIYHSVKRRLYPLWNQVDCYRKSDVNRWLYRMLGSLGILLVPALLVLCHTPRQFEIDMLSIGQGDGIYLQSPEGMDLFIDGGSSSEKQVGTYIIEPFLKYHGVRKVTYWFVTHTDDDHLNGIAEVLAGDVRVEYLVFAKTVEKNEHFLELKAACEAAGTKMVYMQAGDVIRTRGMELECLYPTGRPVFEGTNENSLCLMLTVGDFCGIFTGDLGTEQEEWILAHGLRQRLDGKSIDLLKAGHHGSNFSNGETWLDTLQPDLVIISAGKHNSYGHPGKEFLERLRKRGIPYACTKDLGQIQVTKSGYCTNYCSSPGKKPIKSTFFLCFRKQKC